jgi:hypothetical protein
MRADDHRTSAQLKYAVVFLNLTRKPISQTRYLGLNALVVEFGRDGGIQQSFRRLAFHDSD